MLQERATSPNINTQGLAARQKLDICYTQARERYTQAISQFSVSAEDAQRVLDSAKHKTRKAMIEFVSIICAIDPEFALAISQDLQEVVETLN